MIVKNNFSANDYGVFALFLLMSASIGLFFGWKDRKSKDSKNYLTGDRSLAIFPVVLSLAASFMSTNTILGVPAEVYTLGTQFVIHVIPFTIAVCLSAHVFMPVFYELNMTSVNEYLQLRFESRAVRLAGSFGFIFCTLPYMGVVLYGPSLALSSVTDLSVNHCILIVGLICTFYTSIGGIKGVIWTDVLQCFLMMAGLLMIVCYSVVDMGISEPFRIANRHDRLKLFDFSLNFYRNDVFLAIFIGSMVNWCGNYCISQTEVQRFCATKSPDHARKTLFWNIPPVIFISLLAIWCGIIVFAKYYLCDPISMGIIKRPDQLMPYYVMDNMAGIPGAAGLFVACVFSGSLSTLSSGFNSLAAVTYDDLLQRFLSESFRTKHSRLSGSITQILAASFGLISLALAFFVGRLGTVLQASIALSGSIRGPLFALFCLGLFVPFANARGALTGVTLGIACAITMAMGTILHPRPKAHLNLYVNNCSSSIYEVYGHRPAAQHILPWEYEPQGIDKFIHLSYFFVSVIGFLVTINIGLVVSLLTRSADHSVDPKYLSRFCLPDCLSFRQRSKYDVNP